ncbi:proteinase-activated receptor 1-like [Megalops cyprinoides]|uniref:proteinase-activated receptor 1-like n=1 Tax=Megalops cyprinoides TaxID=118141 RepID=UPI001864B093|nr:proteinase-activated receptor 1-like [Megalops cyprinoides]
MIFKVIILVVLIAVHSAVAGNGTSTDQRFRPPQAKNSTNGISPKSFAGFLVETTDEPIDFSDDFHDGERHKAKKPFNKTQFSISEQTKKFLTSSVMTVFIPTIYTLVFIISVPLNGIAIMMFVLRIQPKKPSAIYMFNLAVADLLFVLLLPFKMSYHFNSNNWVYGPVMCRVVTSSFYCNMYCSILLMMCISVDRFLAVVYPIDSLKWRNQQKALVVCSVTWLLAVAGVMPILLSEQVAYIRDLDITTCHDVLDINKLQGYYLYFFPIFSCLFFFLPLIITTFCYVRIIKALRNSKKFKVKNSKKTRAVFMAIVVLAVFITCFAPTNVILLVHYLQFTHSHGDTSYAAYLISVCMGSVSCCLDPLIYYLGSCQYRKQVATVLHCQASREFQSTQCENSRITKLDTFQGNMTSQYNKLMAEHNG